MIALGWTRSDTSLPRPCRSLDAGDMSLVVAPEDEARRARDRMALQCDCAGVLPDFLPAAPGTAIDAARALDWTAEHSAELSRCLAALVGRVQATLFLERADAPSRPPETTNGAGWLRDRAARVRRHEAETAEVTAAVRSALDPDVPLRLRSGPGAILVDLLIDRQDAPHILKRLACELSAAPGRQARRAAILAAPLPAYGFADIAGPA